MTPPLDWGAVTSYTKGIWAVAGPLLGVLIGAYTANRNQRKQWISDNKKEEYRELLSAISKSLATVILARGNAIPKGFESEKAIAVGWSNVTETIYSRIFIAEEMDRLSVLTRWIEALKILMEQGPDAAFVSTIDKIMSDVRDSARKDMMNRRRSAQNIPSSPPSKPVPDHDPA
jgi:hypothetical protein